MAPGPALPIWPACPDAVEAAGPQSGAEKAWSWGHPSVAPRVTFAPPRFQIAASLSKELCALIFGINTFLATVLKTIITLIVSDKHGLGLSVKKQVGPRRHQARSLPLEGQVRGLRANQGRAGRPRTQTPCVPLSVLGVGVSPATRTSKPDLCSGRSPQESEASPSQAGDPSEPLRSHGGEHQSCMDHGPRLAD